MIIINNHANIVEYFYAMNFNPITSFMLYRAHLQRKRF